MNSTTGGLAGALGFASLAAIATTVLLLSASETPRPLPQHIVTDAATGPAKPRFRGREAFIPDWRRGDALDEIASAHFLAHYWPQLRPQRYADMVAAPAPPTKDEVRIFSADYWRAVDPDHEPGPYSRTASPIVIRAARGESEPVSIGVRTGGVARTISVATTVLSGSAGRIDAEAATNRVMLPYPARRDPGRRPTDIIEKPMVLLKPPGNRWTFPAATAMAYVVDFHVPIDQPAGEYHGDIIISVDGREHERLPVSLTVLPFSLKTNDFHAGAFGVTYDIWAGGFSGYTEEMIEMDSRYGYNLAGGFFNKGYEVPFVRDADGNVRVDESSPKFRKFDATMKLMRRYGMGDVAFWNWGASGNVSQFNRVLAKAGFPGIETARGRRGFGALCAALKEAEGRYGWPEFVVNPYDEALKDQDATRAIIAAVTEVRRQSPNTRLYMTEWREGYTRLYQSSGLSLHGSKRPREPEMRALAASGELPRLNFHVIGANTLSAAAARLQHRLGGELWHYGGASHQNAQARLVYGFIPWIVRADASLIWANYKGDLRGNGWTLHYMMPLDPQGRKHRDTRGPVIASVRAIAVREGIDDRKYIETLRYYATRYRSEADLRYLDTLQVAARNLLKSTKGVGGIDNIEARVARGADMTTLRRELGARITRLRSAHAGSESMSRPIDDLQPLPQSGEVDPEPAS